MTESPVIRPLADDEDAAAFERLNRRWISELFTLTPEDERVLSRPREEIVDAGGEVLVAPDTSGEIVGVVAILAAGPGVYELSKMTVDVSARGQGLGAKLIEAAVAWAREHDATLLFLGTNTRLQPAIGLYEAAGFERTSVEDLGLQDYYARADVLMRLELTPDGPGEDGRAR